jgi:hypothetical protein
VQTEIEARNAEIEVLADATGSASRLLRTDRATMRKMRHADEEIHAATPLGANGGGPKKNGGGPKKNGDKGTR